jgi:hypothetical protein
MRVFSLERALGWYGEPQAERTGATMILGTVADGYFSIWCETCGAQTVNTYRGWDAEMTPRFEVFCPECTERETLRLDASSWSGLPPRPCGN